VSQKAIPDELLFKLFDCAFGVGPRWEEHWEPSPPPTVDEIERIESELAMGLPALLVELARWSPYFVRWFAELSYRSLEPKNHVVELNRWLASVGKPEGLIVFTQAYDGHCTGIMRGEARNPDAAPIMFTSVGYHGTDRPSKPRVIAPNFRTYLEELCLHEAPRTRVKTLRRKAKRLIEEWKKGNA